MFLSADVKHHYLCALSHLLQWIPKQVLLTELPNVSNITSLMSRFGAWKRVDFPNHSNHLNHFVQSKHINSVFFFSASVDAAIGSIFVLWGTEFEALHITDLVLTSAGCSWDYYTSRDFISSHAPGIVKVSAINGNSLVWTLNIFVLRKLEKSSTTPCCQLLLVGFLAAVKNGSVSGDPIIVDGFL